MIWRGRAAADPGQRDVLTVQVRQQPASTSDIILQIVRKSDFRQCLNCRIRVPAGNPESPDRVSPRKRNLRFNSCIASKYVDVALS